MKQNTKKQYAGVWLDNSKAMIISSSSEEGSYAVEDTVKGAGNFSGGSEHAINNAKQSDALKYYKAIAGKLTSYDEVLIFGPGKSQEQLQNHLQEDAQFKNKTVSYTHLTLPTKRIV